MNRRSIIRQFVEIEQWSSMALGDKYLVAKWYQAFFDTLFLGKLCVAKLSFSCLDILAGSPVIPVITKPVP